MEVHPEADMLTHMTPPVFAQQGGSLEDDLLHLAPASAKPSARSRPGTAHGGSDGLIIENTVSVDARSVKLHLKIWNLSALDGCRSIGKGGIWSSIKWLPNCMCESQLRRVIGAHIWTP
jgi:hypothetical protein